MPAKTRRAALVLWVAMVLSCQSMEEAKQDPTQWGIRHEVRCQEPATQKRRDWVMECIKRASPMTDDSSILSGDPEDVIQQCEDTSTRLFCTQRPYIWVDGIGAHDGRITCDLTTNKKHLAFCRKHGWEPFTTPEDESDE